MRTFLRRLIGYPLFAVLLIPLGFAAILDFVFDDTDTTDTKGLIKDLWKKLHDT